MKNAVAVLSLLLLGLLLFWWSGRDTGLPEQVDADWTETTTSNENAPNDSSTPDRQSVGSEAEKEGAVDSSPASRTVTLRGRCVDPTGQPIAGIHAKISQKKLAAGEKWHEHLAVTKADGVFLFRLAPIPDHTLTLTLSSPMHPEMVGVWFGITSSVDVGDVTVAMGCRIRGRVVDTEGVPQERMGVAIGEYFEPDPGVMLARTRYIARTAADGSFVLGPVPPGDHPVGLHSTPLRGPKRVTVAVDQRESFVEIRAESSSTWPSIRGHVFSDAGQPLAGVQFRTVPWASGGVRESGTDGSFAIMKPAKGTNGPLKVSAAKFGFADIKPGAAYPWGTKGLRLVMKAVGGFELRVTDGVRPIERFSVWVAHPIGFRRGLSLRNKEPDRGDFHRGGVVILDDLRDGEYMIKVLPDDPKLLESGFRAVRVEPGPRQLVQVQLGRSSRRGVLVRYTDGAAAIGARVEVLEAQDGVKVDPRVKPHRIGEKYLTQRPYLLDVLQTDETGRAEMRGPSGVDLTLRVSGDAFPTKIVPGVRILDGADPIVVEIELGATLHGKIFPPKFLEQLRAMNPKISTRKSGVFLRRRLPTKLFEMVPEDRNSPVVIGADGRFEIGAVHSGDWELVLFYYQAVGRDVHGRSMTIAPVRGLKSGEQRRQEFDVSQLLFTSLELQVFVDDRSYKKGVYLRSASGGINVFASRSGELRAVLPAGRYRPTIYIDGISTPSETVVDVPPGGDIEHRVHFRTRRVQLHVVGSDGKRRTGVRLWIGYSSITSRSRVKTSAQRDSVIRCTRGSVTLWTTRKGTGTAWKSHVELTKFDVKPGDAIQIVHVELPDSLGY